MKGDLKPKAATTTFRLEKTTLEFLRRQAAEQKTSLNTLVNQIFAKYTEWDAFGQKYGFVSFPHEFYKGIVKSTEEDQLKENAATAGKQLRDYLLFMFKRADTESFVNALKLAGRYSGMGSFELEREGAMFKLVVHHNFGKEHSIYLGAALEEAVRTIVGVKSKTEMTDISVLLEFEIMPSFQPVKGAESLASVDSMT